MKMCIIGKYPPIEGGVSANTYWIARSLSELGHDVHVVTNASEVEDTYRIKLGPEDARDFAPKSDAGGVWVHQPEPFGRRSVHHIPRTTPFVSRLAGLATDVIRRHGCEMIFAYYYEPYGIAATLAAEWTGVPVVMRHAGSDLDRLGIIPELARSYQEALKRADGVMTRPPLFARFIGMGVEHQRLMPTPHFSVPTDVFTPEATPLNWQDEGRCLGPPEEMADDAPIIGFYGKIGETKGTYDLIAALGGLRQMGRSFRLIGLISDVQARILAPDIEAAGLAGRTWVLPFLPHWRVPSFLTACTAVAFLERDFPVAIHGPVVPREVMATGRCLILSGEIAEKNASRLDLTDGETVLLVDDPKDRHALAQTIDRVLNDPGFAEQVGQRGHAASRELEHFEDFGKDWEAAFLAVLRQSGEKAAVAPRATLDVLTPELLAYAGAIAAEKVQSFLGNARAIKPYDLALAFCDHLRAAIVPDLEKGHADRLTCVLDQQRVLLELGHIRAFDEPSEFPAPDLLLGEAIEKADLKRLYPVTGRFLRLETYPFDISALSRQLEWQGEGIDHLAGLDERSVTLMTHRAPNMAVREFAVNEQTHQLLSLCDGTRSVVEVISALGVADAGPQGQCAVLRALDTLYSRGILVFAAAQDQTFWPDDIVRAPPRPRRAARAP